MGRPAAKLGDQVVGTDIHIVLVPSPGGPVPTPTPLPFSGKITTGCSTDVLIEGKPAAIHGSVATNLPPHLPAGGSFAKPPDNRGTVIATSLSVLVNGKPLAKAGDQVLSCNDPVPAPTCSILTAGLVLVG
ncbi:PAAR domain-containing protein [Kribbella sp. CA-293567]|uniref:PAAR domain-containing protein n=1 Tax=Kribbella sp. CA-293567 TaxID=3002436 RepID=UPI0022DDA698|nr:PAAR domain-containing protein [Kribbella sp. CA-293567]WBQ06488.1 PAAR domain-containing protein [Kribbella sp. CA-293567]